MSNDSDLKKIKEALAGVKPEEVKCTNDTGFMAEEIGSLYNDDMISIGAPDLGIDLSDITITSASGTSIGAYNYTNGTVTLNGAQGSSGQYLFSNGGMNGTSWGNVTTGPTPSLTVSGNADFEGDIKWKGRSLGKLLEKIEDRLAILQDPDPEKLEKHAALKKAYDHYKTLERLIGDD